MGDSEAALLPGERLLWTGRPARGRVIVTDLVFPGLLLAVLLLSAAVFSGRSSDHSSGTGPSGFGVFAVSLVLSLAGLIAATVWALRTKPDELRRTVYQVTDRRVLITTGSGRTWAAYLDQLAEPVLVPQRSGTADVTLRATEKFSLSSLNNRQSLPRAFTPGDQGPFPVLRELPDAEAARQAVSTGRERMLRGMLDVPPVTVLPGGAQQSGFVPAPGERILWAGHPQAVPWWFGTADIAFSAYFACYLAVIGFMASWMTDAKAPLIALAFFIPGAVLVFAYPAVGRLFRRRARIRRSTYILTSARLITSWAAGSRPAGTQSPLAQLLAPEVRDGSVFLHPAWPRPGGRRSSWAQLAWPAASTDPPQLIGVSDAQAVADLICSAQLAERASTWQRHPSH
jgi:hypothetical protein